MVTIIGQAPSSRTDGKPPLSGRSGKRIAELAGFKTVEELRGRATLLNLLDHYPGPKRKTVLVRIDFGRGDKRHYAATGDAFDSLVARKKAAALRRKLRGTVVLLGRNVARAFEIDERHEYFKAAVRLRGSESILKAIVRSRYYVVPHPSGANLFWNDKDNLNQARRFFRALFKGDL